MNKRDIKRIEHALVNPTKKQVMSNVQNIVEKESVELQKEFVKKHE